MRTGNDRDNPDTLTTMRRRPQSPQVAKIRPAAVAGSFYPGERNALLRTVHDLLDEARASFAPGDFRPKALIVPHAGYVYSGAVAARAFVRAEPISDAVESVVLVGPSHHVAFDGLAVPTGTAFETPLGPVPIDEGARMQALRLDFVRELDGPHRAEHSLEVQLPFLQAVLGAFSVLPVVVGFASRAEVRTLLDALWGGDETLIVVSSDLSHYHDYDTAKRIDSATAEAIERMQPTGIGAEQACGRVAVQGLLEASKEHGLVPLRLDLRNSGDTRGGRREVVGYGAWALTASKNGSP